MNRHRMVDISEGSNRNVEVESFTFYISMKNGRCLMAGWALEPGKKLRSRWQAEGLDARH
ncbi:MAG TPA: hypothetical protein DEA96_02145 [Leptospiraceae bacterium]|nr:hypothetical protein [Spirochaetaceae bacterium]HBS03736.1 hypothetical protein [Leptospiraceae bacterium]